MPFACPKCGAQFDASVIGSPASLDCPSCDFLFTAATGPEVEAAAKVVTPNLGRISIVGSVGVDRYFASEHIEGDTMAEIIRAHNTNPRMAARAAQQVAEAMEAASARGVYHGALSPESIIIDKRGIARLVNLGVGASPSVPHGRVSSYTAPERVTEFDAPDVRSEIYSLGATLYEMLTGWPPFVAAGEAELAAAIEAGGPTPPRQRNPKVHPDLEKIVMKALALDRDDRHRTFHELAVDLHKQVSSGGSRQAMKKAGKRSSRVKRLSLLLLLLGVLGGGGYAGWRYHQQQLTKGFEQKKSHVESARRLVDAGRYGDAVTQLLLAKGMPHGKELDAEILLLSCRAKYLDDDYDGAIADCARLAGSGAPLRMKVRAEATAAAATAMKGDLDGAAARFTRLIEGAGKTEAGVIANAQIALLERLIERESHAVASRAARLFTAGRSDAPASFVIRAGLLGAAADERRGEPVEAHKAYWHLLRDHRDDQDFSATIAARFVDLTMRPGSGLSFTGEQEKTLRGFAEPAIRIGRKHLREGRLEQADGWFASAESAAADDEELDALAKVMRLSVLVASGKVIEAEPGLRRIPSQFPGAALARAESKLALGRVRLADGYAAAAKKLFAQIERSCAGDKVTRPVAAMAAAALGDALRLEGHRDKAAEAYSRALSVYADEVPAVVEAVLGLGELRHVTKARAEARKMWKKILDDYSEVASTRAVNIARIMRGETPAARIPRLVEGRSALYAADLYYFGALRLEQDNSVIDAMEYYRRSAEAGGKAYWRTALARKRAKELEK